MLPTATPRVAHRPSGSPDVEYPCQPAAFSAQSATGRWSRPHANEWLDLEHASAGEVCALARPCAGYYLRDICVNATLARIEGRAVLVSMDAGWRPFLDRRVRFFSPTSALLNGSIGTPASTAAVLHGCGDDGCPPYPDDEPRPDCSPYVVAKTLELLGAAVVFFAPAHAGQPPPMLRASPMAPVAVPVCALWRRDADALRSATPTLVELRHYRTWAPSDEARPTHLAATLLANSSAFGAADSASSSLGGSGSANGVLNGALRLPAAAASFSPLEAAAVRARLVRLVLAPPCVLAAGVPWSEAAWRSSCAACFAAPLAVAAAGGGAGAGGGGAGGAGGAGGGGGASGDNEWSGVAQQREAQQAAARAALRGAVALYVPANRSRVSPCFHSYAAVAQLAEASGAAALLE